MLSLCLAIGAMDRRRPVNDPCIECRTSHRVVASCPRPIRSVLDRQSRRDRAAASCAPARAWVSATIAVYSDADAERAACGCADEAVRIGPPPARASYLDIDAILAARQQAGADAIHPGYGFLSENAAFAALRSRRADFRRPLREGGRADGLEDRVQADREAAGVPTVPGYHGDDQDRSTLARRSGRIGFPVLIKASAGGGGRGMRRVDRCQGFQGRRLPPPKRKPRPPSATARSCSRNIILNPRHLEVQLAGDRTGNLVHLFERDCSVQRNNQKLLEEAPAPNLPGQRRAQSCSTPR